MLKHRKAILALLALAVAGVFVLPTSSASAGSSTVSNACANSVTPNFSQIEVTTSGDDGLTEVPPGGATTLSGITQSAAIPGDIFVAGYNLGLLTQGENNIPANVRSTIEATNTVQGSQNTNTVGGTPPNGSVTVTTTITDPDGTPGTGDETATDASFSVTYNDLNWTANGPEDSTIDYRQQSIAAAPPTAANNTLLINALVGGVFNVQFRCAPGTVTGPDPGVISLIDPAPSFDTTLINTPVVDQPPVANAGPDQTVTEGDLVTLDGSASSDPNGEAITHNWTQVSGPAVTLTGANTANPTFTAPDVAPPSADLVFQDEVCDEANPAMLCATDTVTVTVNDVPPVDLPPVANAGPDQTVNEGALVTLDGMGSSDPNGEALTFNWTAPAGITLSDPTSANPTFTAPEVAADTPFTFTLEVCDEANPTSLCATDTVVVTVLNVTPVDDPPTANAGPDQTVTEGDLVTLAGSGTDPEGEALTFNWTAPAGITLSDPTSATPTFTAPDVATSTPFTFTLEVCDEANPDSLCATDTVVITVNPVLVADATGVVIVNGPVSSTKTSKSFVFKVTNTGMTPITINETNITSSVDVNGVLTGSVAVNPFTKTLNPGASTRVKLSWSYPAGSLVTGDAVVFHACVNVAGDSVPDNDCDDQSATAK